MARPIYRFTANVAKSYRHALAIAATTLACAAATATPVTLAAFESKVFNFDATALLPYNYVAFDVIVTNYIGPFGGNGTLASEFDGGGSYRAGCATNGDFLDCLPIWEAGTSDAGLLDGIFSFEVVFNGPITVDIVALIKDASQNVTLLREIGDTTAAVPEPGSLLLVILGLGAAARVLVRNNAPRPGARRLTAQG